MEAGVCTTFFFEVIPPAWRSISPNASPAGANAQLYICALDRISGRSPSGRDTTVRLRRRGTGRFRLHSAAGSDDEARRQFVSRIADSLETEQAPACPPNTRRFEF